MLGISNICLRLFFSHALILTKIAHLWTDTGYFFSGLAESPGTLIVINQNMKHDQVFLEREVSVKSVSGKICGGTQGLDLNLSKL
jgi:hypothetical protein